MSDFILQATFDSQLQDLILKTENYCVRNSDRDSDFSNRELVKSLFFDFRSDQLRIRSPRSRQEEIAHTVAILTLEYFCGGPFAFFDDDAYEDLSIAQLYARYITDDLPADKELHLLIYLNLERADNIQKVEKLLASFPQNLTVTLDVMLNPVNNVAADLQSVKNNLLSLVKLKQKYSTLFGNIFYWETIDNHGAAHDYSSRDLVETFGKLVLAMINDYSHIVNDDNNYPITIFSLNSLQIDKFEIIENWCHWFLRDLIKPLVQNDQDENTIDKNKVHAIICQILDHEKQFISNRLNNGEEASGVSDDFKSKILEIIQQNELNIREKEYLLSCCRSLLDRTSESELLDSDGVPVPDELYADLLSGLTDSDAYLKLRDVISKIHSLKKSIQSQEQQIEELKQHLSDISYDGELSDNGFLIHGQEFHTYSFKETPLESNYQPKSLELPSSADLRKYFTVIKNQGKQGACASFSLVSVFEYFMANGTASKPNLSEAFVYYNAREKEGVSDKDNGTTLQNVIKAMTESGICVEDLCPYNEKVFDQKPNDEAYSDGQKRKVVNAQNVQLDVETVKAAINEGYPVVASFRVFDSLAKNVGGFVPMPSSKERENEKKDYHAMVICGYSDEHGYFIVRNSWGKNFGDKGYCYIPYAYVRDPELTTYACTITGIDITTTKHKADKFLYDQHEQSNNIQYSILQNQLIEDLYRLNNDRKTLEELMAQYAILLQSVIKGDCLDEDKAQLDKNIANREPEIQELQNMLSRCNLSSQKISNIVHTTLSVCSLASIVYGIFSGANPLLIVGGGVALLLCFVAFFIRQSINKKRRSAIQSQIEVIENGDMQLQQNYQKKVNLQKIIDQLIGDVKAISTSSKQRKELLSEIEKLLTESYKWLSETLSDDLNSLLFPERYQQIASEIKDKLEILPSLFIDGFNSDNIKDAYHSIQNSVFQHFRNAFDLKIEDFYGLDTDEWRKFDLKSTNLPYQAQVTLTQNEPGVVLFFSNINKPVYHNSFPVYVNNNQYLYLGLVRVNVDNNLQLFTND